MKTSCYRRKELVSKVVQYNCNRRNAYSLFDRLVLEGSKIHDSITELFEQERQACCQNGSRYAFHSANFITHEWQFLDPSDKREENLEVVRAAVLSMNNMLLM